MTPLSFLLSAILVGYVPTSTHAHGRMIDPPSRQSAYMAGFPTPVNYNDHEMNCGGRYTQYTVSGGKCGICGDPWPGPRLYERPNGTLVQHNVITATYKRNQIIDLLLQLTVGHMGWHEFRICNIATSGGVEATQECLDKGLLADENGQTRFYYGTDKAGFYHYYLVLPEDLVCEHCMIQWMWKCGNDWGCSSSGCCVGCGDIQEMFYACSDVTIAERDIGFDNSSTQTTTTTTTATTTPTTTTTRIATTPTTTTTRSTTLLNLVNATTSQPQAETSRISTRAPTTTSTTTTSTTTTTASTTLPTTIKPALPSSNSRYDPFWKYIQNNPHSIPNNNNNNSIKFGDSSNPSNSNTRTPDEILADLVLGRSPAIVSNGGSSVPIPKTDNVNSYTANGTQTETYDKNTIDRLYASCMMTKCRLTECYKYCTDICPTGQK